MNFKQVVLALFEPVATGFGSSKLPKCLENGPFWDQKWVKNGSKTRFPESDPGPFGMLKQVFLADFEPVLTEFSLFHHMYAPLCALRTYLGAVWWSHVELGEGCRLEDIYTYITHTHTHTYIYISVYIHTHTYIYMCVCVCVCVYVCTYGEGGCALPLEGSWYRLTRFAFRV